VEHRFTGWVSHLARQHTRALTAVARREGLVAEDALDAVQEAFYTFLKMEQARSLVEHDEDAQRLMAVIVRNAARNMRRRRHRARPHLDVEEMALQHSMDSADALIQQAEEHILLKGCIARLAQVQGNVVRMRMLEETSNAEVAESLGLEPNHVAVLLYRAKRSLAACIAEA
jgi:RNA polymerase sigma-70 factor (ECF subfamily)